MTKTELLSRITSAEMTEWMGLQKLRHEEDKEARLAHQGQRSMSGRGRRPNRRR